MTYHETLVRNSLRVYHRNDDGTLEITTWFGPKDDYLDALDGGVPEQYRHVRTGEEELHGWPDRRVEWYGNVGFPVA